MEETPSRDAVWDDLVAHAFELFAKPDDRARDAAAQGRARAADKEEGEQR